MAQQGKNLAVVHFKINAIDGTEVVRVYLCQILDLQELVLELEPCDFRRHRLVVLLVKILKLEGINDLIIGIALRQSAPALYLLLSELIFLLLLTSTAHRKAETATESLTVGSWQDPIEIEPE